MNFHQKPVVSCQQAIALGLGLFPESVCFSDLFFPSPFGKHLVSYFVTFKFPFSEKNEQMAKERKKQKKGGGGRIMSGYFSAAN